MSFNRKQEEDKSPGQRWVEKREEEKYERDKLEVLSGDKKLHHSSKFRTLADTQSHLKKTGMNIYTKNLNKLDHKLKNREDQPLRKNKSTQSSTALIQQSTSRATMIHLRSPSFSLSRSLATTASQTLETAPSPKLTNTKLIELDKKNVGHIETDTVLKFDPDDLAPFPIPEEKADKENEESTSAHSLSSIYASPDEIIEISYSVPKINIKTASPPPKSPRTVEVVRETTRQENLDTYHSCCLVM